MFALNREPRRPASAPAAEFASTARRDLELEMGSSIPAKGQSLALPPFTWYWEWRHRVMTPRNFWSTARAGAAEHSAGRNRDPRGTQISGREQVFLPCRDVPARGPAVYQEPSAEKSFEDSVQSLLWKPSSTCQSRVQLGLERLPRVDVADPAYHPSADPVDPNRFRLDFPMDLSLIDVLTGSRSY